MVFLPFILYLTEQRIYSVSYFNCTKPSQTSELKILQELWRDSLSELDCLKPLSAWRDQQLLKHMDHRFLAWVSNVCYYRNIIMVFSPIFLWLIRIIKRQLNIKKFKITDPVITNTTNWLPVQTFARVIIFSKFEIHYIPTFSG